jgi:8-oxo-dGTP pyrophosphatase MutT (NUDIX family)
MPACLVLVVGAEERVLCVTNRRHGGWGLPGGKMNSDEAHYWAPRITASRELLEETDLMVRVDHLSQVGRWLGSIDVDREILVFHAHEVSGHFRAVEDGTEVKFLKFSQLVSDPVFGDFYQEHFPDGIRHLRETRRL